jgi:hypothetical protein
MVGAFLEFSGKFLIIFHHTLLELLHFVLRPFRKGVIFGNEGQVIERVHVMVDSSLNLLLALGHRAPHDLGINEEDEGEQENADDNGGQAVAPDVNAFVVNHEQTSQYLFGIIEIDTIPVSYPQIILHECRSSIVVPDVMLVFRNIFNHPFLLFAIRFLVIC